MKWKKLTLSTVADALDLVCNMLNDLGIEGIEIIDHVPLSEHDRKAMFIDILPDTDANDKTAVVCFYLEEGDKVRDIIDNIQKGLEELSEFIDVGSRNIEVSETEDLDWINNWKAFFKPFRIDDTIVIKPTWEKLEQVSDHDIVIEIDPGSAFGTGTHETTKLCIIAMKKYVAPGSALLDIGSGSGILSIAGAKLGAVKIMGTDIDPNAVRAACENAEVNHISSEVLTILDGDIITDKDFQARIGLGCYDTVVANILADVLIPLSGVIGQHMKPGGVFITSGIIDTKKEEVKAAILRNGFKILEVNDMGDWSSVVAQK